jgi:hypothetical protein
MQEAIKIVQEEEMIRMLLTGMTLRECSVALGRHIQTVRAWAARPSFLERLKDLSSAIYERVDRELQNSKEHIQIKLEEASERALDRIIKLANESKNEGIALKASQDLLDRDGRVSRQRKFTAEIDNKHTFMDPLTLVHVAKAAQEMDEYEIKKRPKQGELPSGSVSPSDAAG